jgi:translation initiation factor 2 beta subunit (eIF-2beta)/eIF-5
MTEAEVAKAFKYYQDAARNRDAEPEIFEGARIRYYTLKNGDAWLQQEKKRLQTEKLQPVLQEYKNQYQSLENEAQNLKGYTDSIANIRDKQSKLKDNLSGNLQFFKNYLEDKKTNALNYDRYVEITTPGLVEYSRGVNANPIVSYFAAFPSSFSIILDVFIGFLVLFLLVLVIRKVRPTAVSSLSSSSSELITST